jgi:hypothetical protein
VLQAEVGSICAPELADVAAESPTAR